MYIWVRLLIVLDLFSKLLPPLSLPFYVSQGAQQVHSWRYRLASGGIDFLHLKQAQNAKFKGSSSEWMFGLENACNFSHKLYAILRVEHAK